MRRGLGLRSVDQIMVLRCEHLCELALASLSSGRLGLVEILGSFWAKKGVRLNVERFHEVRIDPGEGTGVVHGLKNAGSGHLTPVEHGHPLFLGKDRHDQPVGIGSVYCILDPSYDQTHQLPALDFLRDLGNGQVL